SGSVILRNTLNKKPVAQPSDQPPQRYTSMSVEVPSLARVSGTRRNQSIITAIIGAAVSCSTFTFLSRRKLCNAPSKLKELVIAMCRCLFVGRWLRARPIIGSQAPGHEANDAKGFWLSVGKRPTGTRNHRLPIAWIEAVSFVGVFRR